MWELKLTDFACRFASFPRWRNLNHFNAVMSISFNDGTKHEDISKMIVLASHNILTEDIDLLLLQLCRSYQELSLYITMKLQTEDRIADGRKEYQHFGKLLKVFYLPWQCFDPNLIS